MEIMQFVIGDECCVLQNVDYVQLIYRALLVLEIIWLESVYKVTRRSLVSNAETAFMNDMTVGIMLKNAFLWDKQHFTFHAVHHNLYNKGET